MASKINILITWCEFQIKSMNLIGDNDGSDFKFFCELKSKLEILLSYLDQRMKTIALAQKEEIEDFLVLNDGKVAEKHINIVKKYLKED